MWILFLLIQIIVFRLIFKKLNVPSFICYLFIGILNGSNSLNLIPSFLTNSYGIVSLISLIIIFARASSQIKISLLNKNNSHILFLSIIPGLFEVLSIFLLSMYLTPLTLHESLMLGFIITAVSPAVIVPLMIELQKQNIAEKKKIPSSILAVSSLDDIIAIVGFSVVLSMYSEFDHSNYSSLFNVILILLIFIIIRYIKEEKKVIVIENYLSKLWLIISIILFILVGSFLDFKILTESGLIGILIVIVGIIFRSIGVIICLINTQYSKMEKLFFVVSLIPKATVQAALGAIPLSVMFKIGQCPSSGYWILSIAMIAIIITAPLGSYLISIISKKI